MLMFVGVVMWLALLAGAGVTVSLMLGCLVVAADRGLRFSRLSLSLFCGAAIAGMIAYAISLDSLRARIVFFDDIPEFVHLLMLAATGACCGWLLLRILALMLPSLRAQRG